MSARMSRYDVEYTYYFTGIRPLYLPSVAVYIPQKFDPRRSEFLLMCKVCM